MQVESTFNQSLGTGKGNAMSVYNVVVLPVVMNPAVKKLAVKNGRTYPVARTEPVNGYTGHIDSKGVIRIVRINEFGETDYPMETRENHSVFDALRQALFAA